MPRVDAKSAAFDSVWHDRTPARGGGLAARGGRPLALWLLGHGDGLGWDRLNLNSAVERETWEGCGRRDSGPADLVESGEVRMKVEECRLVQ